MKKKILMIDDEPDFVEMVRMRLEANGYEVCTASAGEEGLKVAQAENPHLILLDVMMPGMDGFQVLRKLRSMPDTKYIPVIMLTARGESKAIFKAQEEGVTDYLIKPCDAPALLETIARHV